MDLVHDRGSMDPVQRGGPWTPGPCFVLTQLELVPCVTKFIIVILAHISSSSQDQNQKVIFLHYKGGFFKR